MESQLLSEHARRTRMGRRTYSGRPNTAPNASMRTGSKAALPGPLKSARMGPLSRGSTVFGDQEQPEMGEAWTETDKGERLDVFGTIEHDPPAVEPTTKETSASDQEEDESAVASTHKPWRLSSTPAQSVDGPMQVEPSGGSGAFGGQGVEGNFIVAWSAEHLPSRPTSALMVREENGSYSVPGFKKNYDARPGTTSSLSMYRPSSTIRGGPRRPGTAPIRGGIGIRGHAMSLHKTRQQELQECEDIKIALARKGIRVPRGVLESALVTPVVNVSPRKTRPRTAPAPTKTNGKGKGKGKGKKKSR